MFAFFRNDYFRLTLLMAAICFGKLACKPKKPVDEGEGEGEVAAGLSSAPAIKALYKSDLVRILKGTSLVYLGTVSKNKSAEVFFPANEATEFFGELEAAENSAKTARDSVGAYRFSKCEQRGPYTDSSDIKDCLLLSKKQMMAPEMEFLFLRSDGKRVCSYSEINCSIHQAVRISEFANSLQRPALYIKKAPLSELNFVVMRPDKRNNQIFGSPIPGDSFEPVLGNRLAKLLRVSNGQVQNPLHLSNIFHSKGQEINLQIAREMALYIVSIPLNLGAASGGMAALSAAGKISAMARYLAVLDVVSGFAGTTWSFVGLFSVRSAVREVPPGPERACLQAAVLIADIAPTLGQVGLAHAPLKGFESAVSVATTFAISLKVMKSSGTKSLMAMRPETIARIQQIVARELPRLVEAAKKGGLNGISSIVNSLAQEIR